MDYPVDFINDFSEIKQVNLLEELYDYMLGLYGSAWGNKFKPFAEDKNFTKIGKFWIKGLRKFPLRAVYGALEATETTYPERPPNYPQFIKLCKQNNTFHHLGGRTTHDDGEVNSKHTPETHCIEAYRDNFMKAHPYLVPRQNEPLRSVKERNMEYIRATLGRRSVLKSLPYDKNSRIDGKPISREESIRRAESGEDFH